MCTGIKEQREWPLPIESLQTRISEFTWHFGLQYKHKIDSPERFLPVELADLESRHVVQMVEAVLLTQE